MSDKYEVCNRKLTNISFTKIIIKGLVAMLNNKKIFYISLAHMMNDWYMNYIQTILPFLLVAGLSVSQGAFLITAFTITSSLLQPIFGYLVDRKNQRWMVYVGTLWMSVLLSFLGGIKSYPLMLLIVALAGPGTAAFHPQASAMVTAVSGKRKGFFQAFFIAFGNVGWSLTPLIAIPFVQAYGLKWTRVFAIPGILVAVLLWFTAPRLSKNEETVSTPLLPILKSSWRELSKIMLVVALRSLTYYGLVAFLPLFLQQKNISLMSNSRLLFIMLFSGAIGGLIGGFISDKFGRKVVIAGSLVLASPLFYLFLVTEGMLSYIFLALAGAALLSSFSVTVVVAQEVIGKSAAMASGLTLGFGIGIGGLGVGLVGILAEHMGITYAVQLLIWLPLLAGLFSLSINRGNKQAATS
jgi:FSR family fosmidomycin resistance protein-like MFS transporter